jgi:hypothetical protein
MGCEVGKEIADCQFPIANFQDEEEDWKIGRECCDGSARYICRSESVVCYQVTMQIEFLEHPEADTIAREDASSGEFFLRGDGTVWYRNALAPGACFVSGNEYAFRHAVEALHRYIAGVVSNDAGEKQMIFVRRLTEDLRSLGALSSPPDSFWPLIVEQAEHGMI